MKQRISCSTLIVSILGLFVATCSAQDTSMAATRNPIIFPQDHETFWRALSSAIHLVGVSVLAYCLAGRSDKLSSRGLTSHTLTRWIVICIFIDSWLFIFISGLLVSGIGLSFNEQACTAGIYVCIVLYASSKLLIYWFLAEKVYFVHPRPSGSGSKFRSPAYQICLAFVLGYVVIIVLAVVGRVAFLRDGHQSMADVVLPVGAGMDGQCVIGIGRPASLSLLVYDLTLNVFFTCMFLYPVYRSSKLSPGLKMVAKRTLIAALVALSSSVINICILTIEHGRELGWICLASCGADIIVNAVAIFIATSSVADSKDALLEPSEDEKTINEKPNRHYSSGIGKGLRKVIPNRPTLLPTVNTGVTSSARGILGTSHSKMTEASTRSVHFSPEVTRQDRFSVGYDVDIEAARPAITGDVSASDSGAERRSTITQASLHTINPTFAMGSSHPRRSVTRPGPESRNTVQPNKPDMEGSPVNVSGDNEFSEALTRPLPSAIYLHLIDMPPLGEPEDTTLEIRQEGRIPRKLPPCLIQMAVAHARKRSKSVDSQSTRSRQSTILKPADDVTDVPSSVDEARTRLHVLSALTDVTSKKRDCPTGDGLLEVEVVTQTDRRIEIRKKKDDLLDDYHGRKYDRRGRSASSSGGL